MAETSKKAASSKSSNKGPSADDDKSNALGPDAPEDEDVAKVQEENAETAADPKDENYDPFSDPDLDSVLAQTVSTEIAGNKKGKSPTLDAVKAAKKEEKKNSE